MKANELRIGNKVGNSLEIHTVNGIYLSHFTAVDKNGIQQNSAQYNLSPVSLTPEILESSGFENYEYNTKSIFKCYRKVLMYNLEIIIADSDAMGHRIHIRTFGEALVRNDLYFYMKDATLHKLQNLIFSLTGDELIINL